MLFFALLLEVTGILAADGGHHWTYEGPHGQDHWPDSYPECGSSAQSPIDIQTDCVTFDPELPALRLHGYEQPGVEPLDLHNNGHTVQLSLPPTLELGGLPRKYVAAQLHLHWGQKGSPGGSEHQINSEATAAEVPGHKELRPGHKDNTGVAGAGQRKSRTLLSHPGVIRPSFGRQLQRAGVTMVLGSRPWWGEETLNASTPPAFPQLHIVHYDSDSYSSLNEAAHRPLGLAVLGVLIEVGETENPAYEHILSHLHEVSHKDQTTSVPPFSVRELLPPQLEQFFRYNGSLTTPPCYQSVLWTVFNRRAQISVGQLERLQQTLFSTEEEPSEALVQNYRAPQPLNQRTVVASFAQVGPLYTTGEMLSLGVGILLGCLCLLLAVYFIARKIRKKRLGNRKSVVFTSAGATREA
ncbi:carbonic anhydrase 14 isoform X2 [Fukomys damarensis]|uniref:carbonic anhydrase 14 isoform X2 n=1 Tax=Fukomys damarensis TaxID=885580 RepID=UPI00053FD9A3|nr:carbonic anhydrase 14 isoform X2 [Fukomys damarensis]